MDIFLLMAAAAIHRTRVQVGFVAFIFHQSMTLLTAGLFSVNRGFKFIDGDLKFTFGTTGLVAIDALLICIGKGCLSRREYQNN
jgi:hypothetical protein